MNKVVYNNCYGGFGLSHDAVLLYASLAGFEISWIEERSLKHYFKGNADGMSLEEAYKKLKDFYSINLDRHDPILVEVVETLGKDANGQKPNRLKKRLLGMQEKITIGKMLLKLLQREFGTYV